MAYDGSLIFDTKIDRSGFEKGMSSLKDSGVKAGKVVAGALVAISTALIGMGTYATNKSIEFESAFAGVRKTVDATETEFKQLETSIINMSKKMPQSASDIAMVMESAGQLGIHNDKLEKFTETMLMLGDATNISSTDAATALARLSNITGMSQDDFDRLGSVIVDLGNNLATTEGEIVEMGLRLAGQSKQIGLSEDLMLGLAGAMSSVGIGAEAGGSAMSRFMQKVNTSVISGNSDLEKFASISGQSSEEFAKQWKDKPQDAIVSFVQGLGKIQESGGDVATALSEVGITSIREVDTLLRLSGASDVLVDALDLSAIAWDENTALMKEAEQRYDTTESKIAILKNGVDALAIMVGDELKESLKDVVGEAVNMVSSLSDAFEKGGFEGLVEELGNVVADILKMLADGAPKVFEMASSMLMSFIDGIMENLPSIMESGMEVIVTFIEAMIEMTPKILELGLEVIQKFIEGINENIPQLLEKAVVMIQDLAQGLIEALPQLIETGKELIQTLITGIKENLPLIMESALNVIMALAEGFMEMLPEVVALGMQLIQTLVDGIVEMLPEIITMALDIIILLADTFIENLPFLIDAGIEILLSLLQGIIDSLPRLVEEVPRIINSFSSAIYSKLPDILKAGIDILMMLIKGLINTIPTLVKNIPQIIMAIVNVFTLFNWWQMGKNLLVNVGKGMINMLGSIGTTAKSLATGAWNAIKGIFSGAPAMGSGFIRGIMSGISGLASSLWGVVRSLAGTAVNTIKGIFSLSNMASIGKAMVQGIWNGITNVTGWILEKIKGFGSSIIKGIKSIFGVKSPSTIMRDVIGKNLVFGIGDGIEAEMPKLNRDVQAQMQKLTSKMKGSVDIEASSVGIKSASVQKLKAYVPAYNEETGMPDLEKIIIEGNNFYIREKEDIERVARKLLELKELRKRGGRA